MYDYFYGAEAEQFSFYRIPKVLFTEERFRSVSAEAKVLYGLLLDRMSLSCKNGWLDKEGRVYIIFTIEEVMTALGCADQKAGKLLHELESKCRLIERKRQGLGKPNLIYVKNFVDKAADNPVDNASGSTAPSPESRFQNRENHDSGAVKITDQESLKSRSNNTENNDTDFSDTDSFPFTSFRRDHGREAKGNEAALRERYRELIAENIAYDALLTDYPYEQDTLEEILELLVDVVCTTKSSVRISGDDKPAEVVRSRFLKLNSEHIRFVVGGLKENTTRIRNMRQYLLGSEQGGTRPVVVLQNNTGNYYCPTLIVAPITSKAGKKPSQPTHYYAERIRGLELPGMVLLEQIKTIDKRRVRKYLGRMTRQQMDEIGEAIEEALGLYVPEEMEAP